MEFLFKDEAEADLEYWYKTDLSITKRIETVLKSIKETPFQGIGKPEPLKHEFSGYWSRRINHEHRIIYTVADDIITVYSLRGHYTR